MKLSLLFFGFLPCLGLSQVEFIWVDSVEGDFSFVENWEYPEDVFVNRWRQLSCDGLCPMEIDKMKDENGRIYDDSLRAFYSYVDTSHLYFTHEGTAQVYEFGDCHYASASKENGKIHIQTDVNIATHTSLHIVFDPNEPFDKHTFEVYLIYNSIRNVPRKHFIALNGTVEISKKKLSEGIIQMRFDLDFETEEGDTHFESFNARGLQHWDGRIECRIEND